MESQFFWQKVCKKVSDDHSPSWEFGWFLDLQRQFGEAAH